MQRLKKRNFQTILRVALSMTIATMRRLLFSKKTIGIIVLCLIPIIIFSLWSFNVFPRDEDKLYTNNWNIMPDLSLNATNNNVRVSIESWSLGQDDFYLNGSTSGQVDHLTIKIVLFLTKGSEIIPPVNLTRGFINSTPNGALRGPTEFGGVIFEGKGSSGKDDWRTWGLFYENMVPFSTLTGGTGDFDQLTDALEQYGVTAPRIGIYVRAFSDNATTEEQWNYDYMELYLKFEEDTVKVGQVGRDIDTIEREEDGYKVFMEVATALFFLFIIPLIAILYASSAVRDDIENHTIVYLITRPVSKTEIMLYKFKGYFISAWIPIAISLIISFLIAALKDGNSIQHLDYIGTLLILMSLNLLAYGAIFFLFALITSYPIVLSLLYVFFWETVVTSLPNVINRFSVTFHIQSMADDMLGNAANVNVYEPFGVTSSFIILVLIIAIFLMSAIFIFNYRDFT